MFVKSYDFSCWVEGQSFCCICKQLNFLVHFWENQKQKTLLNKWHWPLKVRLNITYLCSKQSLIHIQKLHCVKRRLKLLFLYHFWTWNIIICSCSKRRKLVFIRCKINNSVFWTICCLLRWYCMPAAARASKTGGSK